MKISTELVYFVLFHVCVAVSISNANQTRSTPVQEEDVSIKDSDLENILEYDADTVDMLVENGIINGPADGYALEDENTLTDEEDFEELLASYVSREQRSVADIEERLHPRGSRKKRDVTISKRNAHGHNYDPTSSNENVDGCPPYFIQCMSKCYFFSNFVYTYEDARKACAASGADLVAIESVQEDLFLVKKLKLFTKMAQNMKTYVPTIKKRKFGISFDALVKVLKSKGMLHSIPIQLRSIIMANSRKSSEDLPSGWWTSGHTVLPYTGRDGPQEWVWTQTNQTIHYSRWYSNSNPRSNLPCVSMWAKYKNMEWASVPCNAHLGLVCEKDISY